MTDRGGQFLALSLEPIIMEVRIVELCVGTGALLIAGTIIIGILKGILEYIIDLEV